MSPAIPREGPWSETGNFSPFVVCRDFLTGISAEFYKVVFRQLLNDQLVLPCL